jgi:diacylglycerol kinase (ATP)
MSQTTPTTEATAREIPELHPRTEGGAKYKRILVIMNPVSGQHDPDETTRLIETRAARAGVTVEVRRTEGEGDAERWARGAADEGFDVVLTAGGDGTVVEAITGLIRSGNRIPLAQLPSGTASQIALALSISPALDEALELLFEAPSKVVELDVGYLPQHDRYFALITGAGFDARVIEESPRELKRRFGFLAYVMVGVKELFRLKRRSITLELDGKTKRVRGHTAMIVNIGRIDKANISIGPDIWHHDGVLDIIVLGAEGLRENLALAWRLLRREYRGSRHLRYYQAKKRVRITARPPLPTQIDGDPLGETPLEVEIVPSGVRVLVPEAYDPTTPPEAPIKALA